MGQFVDLGFQADMLSWSHYLGLIPTKLSHICSAWAQKKVSFISHDILLARMQLHVSVSYCMPMLAELLSGPSLDQTEDSSVVDSWRCRQQLTDKSLCKYNTTNLKWAVLFPSSPACLFM